MTDSPKVNYSDWRKLVEGELKGASFEQRMLTPTPEGITLQPLYRREDAAALPHVNSRPGAAPFVRGRATRRPPRRPVGNFPGNQLLQPHRIQTTPPAIPSPAA